MCVFFFSETMMCAGLVRENRACFLKKIKLDFFMDKNIVILEGSVGDDLSFRRSQDGKEFVTFTLLVGGYSREYHDRSETRDVVYIRVMCFDGRLVERVRAMSLRNGSRVNILARLNSHRSEYKGISYIQNDVIVRDIVLVRTSSVNNK